MLSSVLIFGRDTSLLDTRALILARAGYLVLTATDALEANRILASQPIHLLILCHTLADEERRNVLSVAHASQPALRTLALVANAAHYAADSPEAILSTLDGPRTLLAAVHELTGTGQLTSPA